MHYHVWGTMIEHYQRKMPKPTNFATLKPELLTIWNDLPCEFIDKAIVSFCNRLSHALLQLLDILNTI